jgi:phosphoglycerol transferase MdoB-like AlkP superfamily enzyme
MGEASSLFTGLKISNYYRYILYVAGVILIVSLFFEAKGVSNQWLRHVAFWTIIAGLLIWFIDVFFNFIEEYMIRSDSYTKDEFIFWVR